MYFLILLSTLIGIILGGLLFYLLSKWWMRGKYGAPSGGAKFSEKEAEGMLRKAGYQILGKQPRETVITNLDGKDHFGYLEADYAVRKNRKTYVVVVRSGEGDPIEPLLRRKLLEYDHVFGPEALLLVDLNEGKIQEIKFKFPREKGIDFYFQLIITLFIMAAVIGIIWLMVTLKLF